jgi:hypothetical protein
MLATVMMGIGLKFWRRDDEQNIWRKECEAFTEIQNVFYMRQTRGK